MSDSCHDSSILYGTWHVQLLKRDFWKMQIEAEWLINNFCDSQPALASSTNARMLNFACSHSQIAEFEVYQSSIVPRHIRAPKLRLQINLVTLSSIEPLFHWY
jgi:hypothetical protein